MSELIRKTQMETARDFIMNEIYADNPTDVINKKMEELGLSMPDLIDLAGDATSALAEISDGSPDAVTVVSFFVAAYLVGFLNGRNYVG